MATCFFASDLHGSAERYETLFRLIGEERPRAVFLGGDLLPGWVSSFATADWSDSGFIDGFLLPRLQALRDRLDECYPRVYLVLGNDDGRSEEAPIRDAAERGFWDYVHDRRSSLGRHGVYGYAYIPPTPFLLKDWERYDVSRYVDPGCVSPEEGCRSVPVPENVTRYATIQRDLERLAGDQDLQSDIFLFHSPPYRTKLDRAALDGKSVDHVPLDVHVGSIAIQRFIEARQPLITLHGHVHESARITGEWSQRIGRTHCFSAAHDGPELALVRFDPDDPAAATRTLV